MHVTAHATVDTDIQKVWDTLTDHLGMAGWGPGISVTLGRPGAPEPNGLGAVRRISTPGPGPDIVEEVTAFEAPHVFGYKALSGTPFPGYTGEVRLNPSGTGTRIDYTIGSTASFPLVKAPLAVIAQVLLRLLVRAASRA
ncbi:SRPBCC family protein [Mycolicibacterium neoaurum]|uniref:SRPBCC family protein n=1 Tax=Mycolicibacterium neoaurum TaxID=1795 RepID=UPI001F15A4B5|nr:SRPBCC family protein [Mycolicibacterium neoaurum]